MQDGRAFIPSILSLNRLNHPFIALLLAMLFIVSCLPGVASAAAISCTATDDQIKLTSSNQVDPTDNTWKISLSGVTVKDIVSEYDLDVQGLPSGLVLSAQKATSENSIIVTLTGSATISSVTTVSVTVNASAIQDSGYSNSGALSLRLVPATIQVAGSATDNSVRMASGNTTIDGTDSKWVINVTSGTVKPSGLQTSDITVTNLPSNLNIASVAKGTGNTLEVTVAGTALSAVNTATTVNIVINGTAVTESQAQNSAAVAVILNPALNRVAGSATDSTVQMASGNTSIDSSNNKWVITLTGGTVKASGLSLTDVTVSLPANLSIATIAKASGSNAIELTLSGTATSAITTTTSVNVVVKSTAVSESGLQDSLPIACSLVPSATKVTGTATDANIKMASGNTSIDSTDNKWVITLSAGTVKAGLSLTDVSVSLPANLSVATIAKAAGSNAIELTVTGTATSAITSPTAINVVVRGSAVNETGLQDSDPITVNLNPAPTKVIGTATDANIKMASGNTSINSTDNKWVITLSAGTVKSGLSLTDVNVSLPANLSVATIAKAAGSNAIELTVTGTATSAITTPTAINVVVRGSAVTETGLQDSDPISVNLNPAPTKVAGSATDADIRMQGGNVKVDTTNNKWVINLTAGTVKTTGLTVNDLSLILPTGLSVTNVAKVSGNNSIEITVDGTASPAITTATSINVVVRGSAVSEIGLQDSSAIPVNIVLGPTKVAGTATTASIQMTTGNQQISASGNKWVINLTAGTVKTSGLTASNISVTNLPNGLNISTVAKSSVGNSIEITAAGTANPALSTPATVNVVVRGTAVSETGMQDSSVIPVSISLASTKVAGTVTDDSIQMAAGNQQVDSANNKWVISLTAGTVKSSLSASDLTVTNLPSGLSIGTVAKSSGSNSIEITLAGTASSALTTTTTINVVVKASAVIETGMQDSSAIPVKITLAAIKVAGTATDGSIQMTAGNQQVDTANNKWVINLTSGSVKTSGLTTSDISLTLPNGLNVSNVAKSSGSNSIEITLAGTANPALTTPATINVVVKNSAVSESGMLDSSAIPATIALAATTKIAGTPTDASVKLAPGNTAIDSSDNKWVITLSSGTVRSSVTTADVIVTGLPANLTFSVAKAAAANAIELTISGTAINAVTTPTTITVVIKGSAVTESGFANSDQISLTLTPISDCFIATAAFGSYLDSHVMALRIFRDQVLMKYGWGQWFVKQYYHYSPPLAAVIANNSTLRFLARLMLTPIVFAVEYPAYLGVFLLLILGVMLVRRFRPGMSSI